MADAFFEAFNTVDGELSQLASLIVGASCVEEHGDDMRTVTNLLYIAEKKVEFVQELVHKMHRAHDKAMGDPAAPSQPEGRP
jgi:hypothetical protein